jgi:hypothetical protein
MINRHAKIGPDARRGAVALITVIMLGALVLTLGLAASYSSQTQIIASGDLDYERSLYGLVSACVDEAVFRLKFDPAYTGGTVPLGSESCAVTVSGSGNLRSIYASAAVSGYTKAVTVSVSTQTNSVGSSRRWTIGSWQETAP